LSALALSGGPTIENVVERIARLMHPADDPAVVEPGNGSLEAQVLAVSEQHVAGLSAADAAAFTAELADSAFARANLSEVCRHRRAALGRRTPTRSPTAGTASICIRIINNFAS
jgi:hypothetical protein